MADETLAACKACGADAEIVESVEDGQHLYQGQCTDCDATAPVSANRQRAIDFWQGWQEDAGGTMADEDMDLDLEEEEEEDSEDDDAFEDEPV